MKNMENQKLGRRGFIKMAGAAVGATLLPVSTHAREFKGELLQVWSCGGLAEAFMPANDRFEEKTGARTSYTGAFAGALGKSLLGSARTDVFAGRVLGLAKKLRETGKMAYFKPLCFTEYVLVTPKGNPAGIESVQDLARPGVKVVLAPDASPPGGAASLGLLKEAGVKNQALENAVVKGSCVQMVMPHVISGTGDVSVMERRMTRLPRYRGKVDVISIPDKYFPVPPLTFTIGVMKSAANRPLADAYVDFITSAEGQACFQEQGFIPALSNAGEKLIEKLGVKDV